MINATRIEEVLRKKYPDLDQVGNGIFRGVDKHAEREYAVRYFDLTDRLLTTAEGLKKYQEDVLSDMYFSSQASTDLRWNHYLYFVTSAALAQSGEFRRAKCLENFFLHPKGSSVCSCSVLTSASSNHLKRCCLHRLFIVHGKEFRCTVFVYIGYNDSPCVCISLY